MRRFQLASLFVLLAAAMSMSAMAQELGSITGTVKDSSGAVVVGAAVTATARELGVTEKAQTNGEGVFVFPQLPPGNYSITAEKTGFKKAEHSGVELLVSSKVNVGDVILAVGAVTDTVTVQEEAGQIEIQSDSGERSDVVTNRELRNIPLNGLNIVDLMRTIPGVNAGSVTANAASTVNNVVGTFNVNGSRSNMHEYTVDGITNINLGNNTGAIVSVNPDALEEVKVLTSNYQAEYGRAGGGFIALTTRSGTNDLHGGASYYRRHDSLNADPYFNDERGGAAAGFPRPLYRYNYWGYNVGGPVVIPHVVNGKNKLFFFFSSEIYQQLVPQAASVNIRTATAAERTGDFSNSLDGTGKIIPVIDPTTGKQFPNNIIPAGRIYAPGEAILNFLPSPNTTAGGNNYNYTSQIPSAYPRKEYIMRGDYQMNSTTRLSVRWVYNIDDQQFAYGTTTASWNWPLTITDRKNGPGSVPTISLTKSFGPSVVNEFIFGVARGGVTIAPEGNAATRATSGINTPLLYPDANVSGLIPSLGFGSIASASATATTSVFGVFAQRFLIWHVMDNATKVWGKHVFKAGFYVQSAANASNQQTHVESDLDFSTNSQNPLNTGQPFANALLGVYNGYTQANAKPYVNSTYHDISWYVQDTWKVTSRLTLDLGVRFSWFQPYYNAAGDSAYFNPADYNPAMAPRIYRPVCVGAATCSSGAATYRAIDPASAGGATLANTQPGYYVGKLVPNTGNLLNGLELASQGYPAGGINTTLIRPQPRLGFAWDVTGSHKTVIRGGVGLMYDRYNSSVTGGGAVNPPIVLTPTLSFGQLQNITPGGGGLIAPLSVQGVTENGPFPAIWSYSVGVQRNFGKGIVVDVAYVGQQTRHLSRRINLNAPAYGVGFTAAAQDPTKFTNGVIPATEPGLPSAYVAANVPFSGADILPTDFLRPYQGYSDITYFSFDGDASYNSLQVSANRRFSHGLTFGLAYTLSRVTDTINDDGTYTNILGAYKYDYGVANFDHTHFLVGTFVWALPKADRFTGHNAFSKWVVDNWTLAGNTTWATGSPTELGLTINGVDAGARLEGTPSSGNLSGESPRFFLTGNPQNSNGTINLSAFQVPGIGQIGPYPRYYLRNPGIGNQDFSFYKDIPFDSESKRYLQLRFEGFNIFNHPQFSGYNLTTNVTNAAGQTGSAIFNNYTGLTVTNNLRPAGNTSVLGNYFGEPNGARDPRVIELSVKFYF
jgi:hypothetical protein